MPAVGWKQPFYYQFDGAVQRQIWRIWCQCSVQLGAGVLQLPAIVQDGAGLTATVLDIEENPYNVEILELEAAQVPRVKDEVAYVVLNGNYALDAGFSVAKDSLAYEKSDSDAAKTYVNVIAVKEGNENSEKIQALVSALKSDAIRQYINDTYDGAVVPFDD